MFAPAFHSMAFPTINHWDHRISQLALYLLGGFSQQSHGIGWNMVEHGRVTSWGIAELSQIPNPYCHAMISWFKFAHANPWASPWSTKASPWAARWGHSLTLGETLRICQSANISEESAGYHTILTIIATKTLDIIWIFWTSMNTWLWKKTPSPCIVRNAALTKIKADQLPQFGSWWERFWCKKSSHIYECLTILKVIQIHRLQGCCHIWCAMESCGIRIFMFTGMFEMLWFGQNTQVGFPRRHGVRAPRVVLYHIKFFRRTPPQFLFAKG